MMRMQNQNISVIVPALLTNNQQIGMSVKCMELAKSKTNVPFKTIIVETCSDYLKDYADIHIYEKEKTNATKSINRALRLADSEYIVLLTNDVYVEDNWLECLIDCFKKEDCGLATLASTQFNHVKHDNIDEGIWFSLAMFKRQDEYFDEGYVNSWDDTDFIMRHYIRGLKMYRNYNCVVEHLVGKTQYGKSDHEHNYQKNEIRFKEKFKDYKNHRMYRILTEGTIV